MTGLKRLADTDAFPTLTGGGANPDDVLLVEDVSAARLKSITLAELAVALRNGVPQGKAFRLIDSGAATQLADSDYEAGINKAVGAAHAVTLCQQPFMGQLQRVSDCKGDAGTNNITVTASGAGTINGQASIPLVGNWESIAFRWNGTEWNIV